MIIQKLNLKPSHKIIQNYYNELKQLNSLNITNEGALSSTFADLLKYCAKQYNRILTPQYSFKCHGHLIRPDGAILDEFKLLYGLWEAKDNDDNLSIEVKKKFANGYPKDNILFQTPGHAIIWQNGIEIINDSIDKPEYLIEVLKIFFDYQPPYYDDWKKAVEEFKNKVPELGALLLEKIENEYHTNPEYISKFQNLFQLCRVAINPNISKQAVEEMLIQHLLTERIFQKVLNNPDFTHRNIIAKEIEKVVKALTSRAFSRNVFLENLDRFYLAIERTALSIDDFTEKQFFMNTVYEKFFQGFSVKIADTHGIVYTPQPIVDFMVNSVEEILQKEFRRSLSDKGVHILDPFVGSGNFVIHTMDKLKKTALAYKYENEIHCNEVMLLPYYIASMNIEHKYFELTGVYKPFKGICLVDTFELAEKEQFELKLITEENTERVKKLKETPLFVIIGNPPYNVGQINENDNNKNRKYPVIDQRVRDTYSRHSRATNKTALSDPYVKAIRWASDKIIENGEGIVAFVSNNSFIEKNAFDGMRKHLETDFSKIYHINLRGDARTSGLKRRKEAGNVFDDAIRVSVGITFFIKLKNYNRGTQIFLYTVDDYLKSQQKKDILAKARYYNNIRFTDIIPDSKHVWLNRDLNPDFDTFIPMGTIPSVKKTQINNNIFSIISNGNDSGRDAWVYNFQFDKLKQNCKLFSDTYNAEIDRWVREGRPNNLDEFVLKDHKKIKWTRNAKRDLSQSKYTNFSLENIRSALYRPYLKLYLYSGKIYNKEVAQIPKFLPNEKTESDNIIICLTAPGCTKAFHCIVTSIIPDLHLTGDTKCFPFYIYDRNGNNRCENITDWALDNFRKRYQDKSITKWDIFYYIYALLHHPEYRKKYQANLRQELPHIPFVPKFKAFSEAGKKLAELHVNYENQPEYDLEMIEKEDMRLDWKVKKMKLSKDKTSIIYNDFLTLAGIPKETYEYQLGNRSALEWIINQYREKNDEKRSGIENNPNREEDPQYIVNLIKKVIRVSLETVKIVKNLPDIK